jgi:hypothetical protein
MVKSKPSIRRKTSTAPPGLVLVDAVDVVVVVITVSVVNVVDTGLDVEDVVDVVYLVEKVVGIAEDVVVRRVAWWFCER